MSQPKNKEENSDLYAQSIRERSSSGAELKWTNVWQDFQTGEKSLGDNAALVKRRSWKVVSE